MSSAFRKLGKDRQLIHLLRPVGGSFRNNLPVQIIGGYCIIFGLTGVFIDISQGHYALKIPLMIMFFLLIFWKKNYSFLMGLLIPCYFILKAPGSGVSYDSTYQLSFSHVLVILMALSLQVNNSIGRGIRRGAEIDPAVIILALFVCISLAGGLVAENWFLFVRRIVEIGGFFAAYSVGRKYNSFLYLEAKMLLLGLGFSLFAFSAPWTIGLVIREGMGVLAQLDSRLNDVSAQDTAIESGISLLIFAFSFTLGFVSDYKKIKSLALLVYFFAATVTLFFVSKAAILMLVMVVVYTLFMTSSIESLRRKRLMTWTGMILVIVLFLALLFLYFPGLVDSFLTRFSRIERTSEGRLYVFEKAIEIGVENLIVGVGAGQFRIHTDIWHAHNDTLNTFAEHGLIGMMSYLSVFIYFGRVALRMFRLKKEFRILSVIYGSMFLAYMGYSQVEIMFSNRAGLLFMFISGWLVSGYRLRKLYA